MPGKPRRDTGNPAYIQCTHRWWDDEPDTDEAIPFSDPRAQAAFIRGYAQGLADLHNMK